MANKSTPSPPAGRQATLRPVKLRTADTSAPRQSIPSQPPTARPPGLSRKHTPAVIPDYRPKQDRQNASEGSDSDEPSESEEAKPAAPFKPLASAALPPRLPSGIKSSLKAPVKQAAASEQQPQSQETIQRELSFNFRPQQPLPVAKPDGASAEEPAHENKQPVVFEDNSNMPGTVSEPAPATPPALPPKPPRTSSLLSAQASRPLASPAGLPAPKVVAKPPMAPPKPPAPLPEPSPDIAEPANERPLQPVADPTAAAQLPSNPSAALSSPSRLASAGAASSAERMPAAAAAILQASQLGGLDNPAPSSAPVTFSNVASMEDRGLPTVPQATKQLEAVLAHVHSVLAEVDSLRQRHDHDIVQTSMADGLSAASPRLQLQQPQQQPSRYGTSKYHQPGSAQSLLLDRLMPAACSRAAPMPDHRQRQQQADGHLALPQTAAYHCHLPAANRGATTEISISPRCQGQSKEPGAGGILPSSKPQPQQQHLPSTPVVRMSLLQVHMHACFSCHRLCRSKNNLMPQAAKSCCICGRPCCYNGVVRASFSLLAGVTAFARPSVRSSSFRLSRTQSCKRCTCDQAC